MLNKILVIIPAYNEEKNIGPFLHKVKNYNPEVDILLVDDGSRDETAEIARQAEIKTISLPINLGYGACLQTGYKYALEKEYDYIVQLDADGQHEPKDIEKLLKELKENNADLILGSRFLNNDCYQIPIIKLIGMKIFAIITSIIIGKRITDSTSGFQAFTRDIVKLYTSDSFPVDFPDADVLILTYFAGFKIKEVSVKMYPSTSGKSMHQGLNTIYYIFKMFLSILVTLLRKKDKIKGVIK